MLNTPNHGKIQFTWQDMLWRLLVTLLLLLFLAGFGLTVFNTVTNQPDTQVLPTLPQGVEELTTQ